MGRPNLRLHRKFSRLVRMLRLPEPFIRGYLEYLWEPSYESGDALIGDAVDVEARCQWQGGPGELAEALASCGGVGQPGFIEKADSGLYQIHDLYDHAPDYVRKRMEREFERQARGETISDLRRAAAKAMHERRKQKHTTAIDMQTAASGNHLHATGITPAPAPAPAPAMTIATAAFRRPAESPGWSV